MDIERKASAYGLPVVTWEEPRAATRRFLPFLLWERRRTWTVSSSLSVDVQVGDHGDGRPYRAFLIKREGKNDPKPVGAILEDVTGFSLHTANELYESGVLKRPDKDNYRDELVLVADVSTAQGQFALTYTSASRSDVMRLHGLLTDVFIKRRAELVEGIGRAVERYRTGDVAGAMEHVQRNLVPPDFEHAGRRFVAVRAQARAGGGEGMVFDARPATRVRVRVRGQHAGGPSMPMAFARAVFIAQGGDPSVNFPADESAPHMGRWETTCEVSLASVLACGALVEVCQVRWDRKGTLEVVATKLPGDLRGFLVMDGTEISLPEAFHVVDGMAWDVRTAAVFAMFEGGALLPVCFGFSHERADLEAVRATLIATFVSAHGAASKVIPVEL